METATSQDKSLDKVLDRIDWEKLGVEGQTEPGVEDMDAIACPVCGIENPADLTYCGNCRVNLKLARKDPDEIERALRNSAPTPSPEPSLAPGDILGGLLVQQGADDLKASIRWFSWERLLVAVSGTAAVLLFALVLGSGRGILSDAESGWDPELFIVFTFPLVLGLWGLYTILGIVLNRTDVEVSGGEFRVRHGPVAIRRKWAIGCDVVWKLQVEEVRTGPMRLLEQLSFIPLAPELFQLSICFPGEEKKVLLVSPDREVVVSLASDIEKCKRIQAPQSRHSGRSS